MTCCPYLRGALAVAGLALAAGGAHALAAREGAPVVRVRASEAFVPCVSEAGRVYGQTFGTSVTVSSGAVHETAGADVLVGAAVEINRALEGGLARTDSDVLIARVPWVLVVERASSSRIEGLQDLATSADTVEVLGGPAGHEARRALAALPSGRVREIRDAAALRASRMALVPLSVAGPGRRIPVDVAPLVAQAAIVISPQSVETAQAFVIWLGSEAGQTAFASCGSGGAR